MTAMGRVAVVRNHFLPYSETFIHDELRHHRRYQATVFTRRWRNARRYPGHRVIAVERLPEAPRPLASLRYSLTGTSPRHERIFRQEDFHLVHAHFGYDGIQGLHFARRHRLPLVVSLHGHDVAILMGRSRFLPEWWHYWLGRRALFAEATLFLAASSELRDLVIGLGCPAAKVAVHRLGVDLTRFTPLPVEAPGPPRVVMVGRFVEKKGHRQALLAAAAAMARGAEFRLVLIGDGPLRPRCERLARELGLAGRTEFAGVLEPAEVRRRLQGAALLLAPSLVARDLDRESGVISAKEGAACGLPVLGTEHGGLPEIVDHGRTGFLVAEGAVEPLAARLLQLLGDPGLRRAMGAAGRRKMEREYDVQERVEALEAHYDEAIARFRRERSRT